MMKLKTNKNEKKRKKIEIKRIRIKLKKKYVTNCHWMPKLKTNETFIKWSWKKIINKKNKNLN
jgi:hypothetical protein